MRCIRCDKEIMDDEVLCEECSKDLRKESSRSEVEEFEREIESNKLLNEDENTKELPDLESLVDDQVLREEISEDTEILTEDPIDETREDKYRTKKDKKKLIIIIIACSLILFVAIISLILFFNKPVEEVIEIDYEKVLSRYGKKIENKLNGLEEIPKWEDLIKDIEYDYTIDCKTHEIYENKKIYLNECTIDEKNIKYSYGEEQKEVIKKSIDVYKNENVYNNTKGDLVGTITCEEETCDYVRAFDNYAIIKENSLYNLYNYKDNKKVFGPFNDITNLIYLDNTLYGIYYSEDDAKNIYSLVSGKTFKGISGRLVVDEENFNPTVMYKYGYVMLNNKNYSFLNLKTGKTDYTIQDNILKLEEDKNNNIVYILTYKKDINTFKVINSHGKELFNKEINYFKLTDDGIVISDKVSFTVYDSKLNKKVSSKTYDSIINMYDDCAIVMDSTTLKLVDLKDNVLASFELGAGNEIDKEKSGWTTVDGQAVLYIYIKNSTEVFIYNSTTGEMEYKPGN